MLRLAIRRFPKGNEGKRVSSGYNRRRRLATRSSGKQQVGRTTVRTAPIVCPEESPLLASTGDNFAARNSPWRGLTRRLRREGRACSPMGRSHFSFGGERKVCKRKPAARRLREKALYCPFLKEGVRNVARSMVKLPTWTFVRARAHSFPLSKRARLFPSAAYRRSAPPQLAAGKRTPCRLRCFVVAGRFCGVDKWADVLFPQSAVGIRSPCRLGCFLVTWVFLQRKRPAGFQIHAGLYCEP